MSGCATDTQSASTSLTTMDDGGVMVRVVSQDESFRREFPVFVLLSRSSWKDGFSVSLPGCQLCRHCRRSFQVPTLSIRSSWLGELDPAVSGVEVIVFPSLLRKDETEPEQTLGGGQDPLRSQLCHQLASCGFGRASCHAHSGVQQLLLGALLAWLTACGVFAWEIFGYPCDGWLLKSSQQV